MIEHDPKLMPDMLAHVLLAFIDKRIKRIHVPPARVVVGTVVFDTDISDGDPPVDSSHKIKVSSNDTTEDFLINKIVVDRGITATEINDAGDEDVELSVTADYSDVTANDGSTNVTGAELEELTDGSVTTLHSHTAGANDKVKIAATDTTPNYLFNKLTATTPLTLIHVGAGGNESLNLTISSFPGSATDNTVPRFNGITGKIIQTSGCTIDDNDNINIPGSITHDGPAADAYLSGDQLNLTDNTWVLVQLDGEEFDVGSIFDTGTYKFTPTVAGRYRVTAQVHFKATILDGKYIYCGIFINNVFKCQDLRVTGSASKGHAVGIARTFELNGTTDYVTMKAKHWNGTNTPDLRGGSEYTFMQVEKVG